MVGFSSFTPLREARREVYRAICLPVPWWVYHSCIYASLYPFVGVPVPPCVGAVPGLPCGVHYLVVRNDTFSLGVKEGWGLLEKPPKRGEKKRNLQKRRPTPCIAPPSHPFHCL